MQTWLQAGIGDGGLVPAYLTPTDARRVRMCLFVGLPEPDTRPLIAVVSLLGVLFFDSRALQKWRVVRLVEQARLDVQLARHPSIHPFPGGERGEMAVGVRPDAGR